MKFINKILNLFRKNKNPPGYINQSGNLSSSTYTLGNGVELVSVWDTIKLNIEWECVQCESFSPHTCNHCLVYAKFVHTHAPDQNSASDHLLKIFKYHEHKRDGLYSWEDYEKE